MRTNIRLANVRERINRGLLYIILIVLTLPIVLGYIWIFISTFSFRAYGIMPVDGHGNIGGFTLSNWRFLYEDSFRAGYGAGGIWLPLRNTLIFVVALVVGVLIISMMSGYALSRIKFPARKNLLSATLILNAFPSIILIIPIFFVLKFIRNMPVLGKGVPLIGGFGYNSLGGVILVYTALYLPFGIWLMKGFFDNISWDMECQALVDGCSRFKTFWVIMVPQIRPGISALATLVFMDGWCTFMIPFTFLASGKNQVLSIYVRRFFSLAAPCNYGIGAAVGLIQLIPIIIFYIVMQKYLLNIFGGGTKGVT